MNVTIGRSIESLISRGSVVLLILITARVSGTIEADHLGYALAVSAIANLISSIGIPTLVMRQLANAHILDGEKTLGLIQIYLLTTIIATSTVAVILDSSAIPPKTTIAICLMQCTSSIALLADYMLLGFGKYEKYVRLTIPIRGLTAIGSISLAFGGHIHWALLTLALGHILPAATPPAAEMRTMLRLVGSSTRSVSWSLVLSGLSICGISSAAALLGNIDVVLRNVLPEAESRLSLRLAMLIVNGTVATLPLDFVGSLQGAQRQAQKTQVSIPIVAMLAGAAGCLTVNILANTTVQIVPCVLVGLLSAVRLRWRTSVAFLNGGGYELRVLPIVLAGLGLVLMFNYLVIQGPSFQTVLLIVLTVEFGIMRLLGRTRRTVCQRRLA